MNAWNKRISWIYVNQYLTIWYTERLSISDIFLDYYHNKCVQISYHGIDDEKDLAFEALKEINSSTYVNFLNCYIKLMSIIN